MKLSIVAIAFTCFLASALMVQPANAAASQSPGVVPLADNSTAVNDANTAAKDDVKAAKDKDKRSKKNDDKDGDPNDGDAGSGNDDK